MRINPTNLQETRLNVQKNRVPCRHLENGRTQIPKLCIFRYECWKCAFDQWLDQIEAQPEDAAVAV